MASSSATALGAGSCTLTSAWADRMLVRCFWRVGLMSRSSSLHASTVPCKHIHASIDVHGSQGMPRPGTPRSPVPCPLPIMLRPPSSFPTPTCSALSKNFLTPSKLHASTVAHAGAVRPWSGGRAASPHYCPTVQPPSQRAVPSLFRSSTHLQCSPTIWPPYTSSPGLMKNVPSGQTCGGGVKRVSKAALICASCQSTNEQDAHLSSMSRAGPCFSGFSNQARNH